MQNKGLVKLFALLFGLVSIYQLSFTFKGNQIESQAKEFAVAQFPDTIRSFYLNLAGIAEKSPLA